MSERKVTVTLKRVNKEGYSVSVDKWRPVVHQKNKSEDFLRWDWRVAASSGLTIDGAKIHFFAKKGNSRFVGTGQNLGGSTAKAGKTGRVRKDEKFRDKNNQYKMTIWFTDSKRENGDQTQKIVVDPEYRVEW